MGIILLSFTKNQKGSKKNSFTTERERQARDKMAAIAAMRTTLTHLGFTQDMAAMITNVQGVDSIDELKFLNDKGVEGLCNNIRKPGGMMPKPRCWCSRRARDDSQPRTGHLGTCREQLEALLLLHPSL